MYKYILIDLDNTVLDFDAAEAEALPKAVAEMGVQPTPALCARYHEINNEEWEKYERGEITRSRVLIERFERLFAEYGVTVSPEETEKRYRGYLSAGHCLVPGAAELLEYLKSRGCSLYIASNGIAETQHSRMSAAGITEYFSEVFISETTGFHKPEQGYFAYCFRRIPGFSKADTLLIGDSLTSDISGGVQAGIDTCWFNRYGVPQPDFPKPTFTVRTLEEIRTIL